METAVKCSGCCQQLSSWKVLSTVVAQSFKATAKGKGKLQNSSAGDIWLHCVALILLTSTIAIGIWQLVAGAKVRSPLLISVLWAVYANIPPFLLVGLLSTARGTASGVLSYLIRLRRPISRVWPKAMGCAQM